MHGFHFLPTVEMQRAESSGRMAVLAVHTVLGAGSERGSPCRG